MAEVAHVAHVLLAAHGVNHRTRTEEQQRLEKRVREHVEDSGGKCSDAERKEHVAKLRDGGIGEYALDVVLHEANGCGEDRGQGTDDRDRLHRGGREHEQSVRARDHIDASRHHRRGMDKRGHRSGAFHSIGQPDVERKLRRFAAGSDEEQQSRGGDDGIADREMTATSGSGHVDEAQRSEIPGDEEHPEKKSGVADAVDDEGLVSRVGGGLAMEIETDQKI